MYDEQDFPRFFVDTREAEAALFTKTRERVEKAYEDRQKGVRRLREVGELTFDTQATLPAEATARVSASESGHITIAISELTSFADVTEVVGVLFDRFKNTYQTEPYIYNMPESRAKDFSIGNGLTVRAKLGEDADCKVVYSGKVTRPYIPEATAERIIICPGDPRYDDY